MSSNKSTTSPISKPLPVKAVLPMTIVLQTQAAIQKRYIHSKADDLRDSLNTKVHCLFPTDLSLLKVKNHGKTKIDYGSASNVLNFISHVDLKTKIGKLSLGWTYESDKSMITNPGKTRSQVSTKHLEYLEATMQSLCNYDCNIS